MSLGKSKEDGLNIPLELGRLLLVSHRDCNLKATAFQRVLVDVPSLFLTFVFVSFPQFATTSLVDSCFSFSLVYGFPQSGNLVGLFFSLVCLDDLSDLRRMVCCLGTDAGGAGSGRIKAHYGIAEEE